MRFRKYVIFPLLLCIPLACTPVKMTDPSLPPVPSHTALLNLSVSIGTSVFLSERPALAPLVWRIARDAAATIQGPLDVTQLGPTLMVMVNTAKISPEYKNMLGELVHAVLAEVQMYVVRAKLTPTQIQLIAGDVLAAMERAALAKLGGAIPLVILPLP